MKPRKDQTDDQRIMREIGTMIVRYLPDGADMKLELNKLWRICPHGYKDFHSFYVATHRHFLKTINS